MSTLLDEIYFDLTNRFAFPAVKQQVAKYFPDTLVKECLDALAALPGSRSARNCRIYVDGRQLGPFEAKEVLGRVSEYPDLASIDWHAALQARSFFIFVNFAALFSEKLYEASRILLGDFCDRFEPDGVSVENHLIIGNYDETPFGVHVDDAADRVLHFNLGPAAKVMSLWPRDEYLARYKDDAARPVRSVDSAKSEAHLMLPGSCFLLPADYYHVARSNEGVSVVVALALTRMSEPKRIQALVSEAQLQLLPEYDPH